MPLHVQESGPPAAPTIVFLHGGGVGGWSWRPHVAALQVDFHCLVPDLPEHGHSLDCGPLTIFDTARQVAQLISQRAHAGKAHVVGHSLGGQVVVALLGLAARLVDHAFISSALLQPQPLARLMGPLLRLYAPIKDQPALIRANMRSLGVPSDYYPEFAAGTRQATPAALERIFRANLTFQLPPGLTRLTTPTLVTAGEREPRVMRRSARALSAALLGGQSAMVRGRGHNWPLAAPDLFNRALRAWIAGQPLPPELVPVPRR